MKRIMIVADDFGLSPAVSDGIVEAIVAGRLSGTSVMTNRPACAAAVRHLRAAGIRCDIGLHVNLTFGRPVGAMPGLAPEGRLPTPARLFWQVARGEIRQGEIEAEVARQVDAFEEHVGRPPDFVDGHQHVHAFPRVRGAVVAEIVRRGLADRLWLRHSGDALGRIAARRIGLAHATALTLLSRRLAAAAKASGIATNEGFSGVCALEESADIGDEFRRFLVAPGARHLVMCHPGRLDADPAQGDAVRLRRLRELDYLLSDAHADRLAAAGLAVARWAQIAG